MGVDKKQKRVPAMAGNQTLPFQSQGKKEWNYEFAFSSYWGKIKVREESSEGIGLMLVFSKRIPFLYMLNT